jgi:hypothetical protein
MLVLSYFSQNSFMVARSLEDAPRSKGHVTEVTFYEATEHFNTASGNGLLKIQVKTFRDGSAHVEAV